jgi:hypothetical protein
MIPGMTWDLGGHLDIGMVSGDYGLALGRCFVAHKSASRMAGFRYGRGRAARRAPFVFELLVTPRLGGVPAPQKQPVSEPHLGAPVLAVDRFGGV